MDAIIRVCRKKLEHEIGWTYITDVTCMVFFFVGWRVISLELNHNFYEIKPITSDWINLEFNDPITTKSDKLKIYF